nr:syntaxin-41-like isoform X1 [Ipomoea batatas]
MATRNRNEVFRRHRNTLNQNRIPFTSSSKAFGGGSPVIEMATSSFFNSRSSYAPLSTEDPGPSTSSYDVHTVGLAPVWVDVSEEVAANINQTRVKMAELVKAHAKTLTPSFIDGKGDQCRIEALTQEITDLLRKSEKTLQNLSAGGRSEDSSVKRNVQRSLATDLQNLSVDLRKKQSTYLKCLNQTEGLDELDWEMNLNGTSCIVDDEISGLGFNEHQMAKLKNNKQFTEDREKEIKQAMKSVNELAQIMKDISVLVIDQGTIVDRIDHNVQSVAASVEEGTKQLRKAKRNQKEGGMVRCATVLVIVCFILLILLVLKEILV